MRCWTPILAIVPLAWAAGVRAQPETWQDRPPFAQEIRRELTKLLDKPLPDIRDILPGYEPPPPDAPLIPYALAPPPPPPVELTPSKAELVPEPPKVLSAAAPEPPAPTVTV